MVQSVNSRAYFQKINGSLLSETPGKVCFQKLWNFQCIKNIKNICNIKSCALTSIANADFEKFGTISFIYAHQMDSLKRIRQDSNLTVYVGFMEIFELGTNTWKCLLTFRENLL